MRKLNQLGITHIFILVAALGFILFLLISVTFSFKDSLFNELFPKPPSHALQTNPLNTSKKIIIFILDQGWINGAIQIQDHLGVDRYVATLKRYEDAGYAVYASLTPINADKSKIEMVLNKLKAENIPFVFNLKSSDARPAALGNPAITFNKPDDMQHGMIRSPGEILQYKQDYGALFAGIHIWEPWVVDWRVSDCNQALAQSGLSEADFLARNNGESSWCAEFFDYFRQFSGQPFYRKSDFEQFMKFAQDQGMFVMISDARLPNPSSTAPMEKQWSDDLKDLLSRYGGLVVVLYENINPGDWENSNYNWDEVLKTYSSIGGNFWGLSAGPYSCNDVYSNLSACDGQNLVNWMNTAWQRGAKMVHFEPTWYLFTFPGGAISGLYAGGTNPFNYLSKDYNPAIIPQQFHFPGNAADRGKPTNTMTKLATALNVNLIQTPPVTVVSAALSCEDAEWWNEIPVRITWTNPQNAHWHKIERTQNGTDWAVIKYTDGNAAVVNTATDSSPADATWYAYRVSVVVTGFNYYSEPTNSNWVQTNTCPFSWEEIVNIDFF